MGTAMKGLGVISTLMRVRRAWVGMRRTASVRAVTQVGRLSPPPSPYARMRPASRGTGVVCWLTRRHASCGNVQLLSLPALAWPQVKALVLNREDMQWAVEHDYRLTTELQDAMRKQRKKLRAMARARKKEMLEKQKNGDAN